MSKRQIAVVDYGSGNLRSVEKALRHVAPGTADDVEVLVTDKPEAIQASDGIVLPGVGAFAACAGALRGCEGIWEAVSDAVKTRGVPFLGICVGMQLMADRGLEFGETPGFGWIRGDVVALEPGGHGNKVPHMGWNSIIDLQVHPVLSGLRPGTEMYFTHSFQLLAECASDRLAMTDHGGKFVAAVARDNVVGVQFHPEKSQAAGLRLLSNFLEWRA
jgi:glutamine amidotransferase